jgi:hypothetical protein
VVKMRGVVSALVKATRAVRHRSVRQLLDCLKAMTFTRASVEVEGSKVSGARAKHS